MDLDLEIEVGVDPERGVLTDGAEFDGALFDGALFDGALFDGALFDGALFDGALFDGALFDGAELDGALFDELLSSIPRLEPPPPRPLSAEAGLMINIVLAAIPTVIAAAIRRPLLVCRVFVFLVGVFMNCSSVR